MKIKSRRYYIYVFLRIFLFLSGTAPFFLLRAAARAAGSIAFFVLGRYRARTLENLKRALPEKSDRQRERIARGVFVNLGQGGAELIHYARFPLEHLKNIITPRGFEKVDQALARSRGLIVLTAHFGNWELIPAYFRARGHEGYVIGRKLYFHHYDRLLNRLRGSMTVPVLYRHESPKKMLSALKANRVLGMLADQDVASVDGVFVDFFGRRTFTPSGPAALAWASGAVILPAVNIRKKDGFELIIEDPLYADRSGDKKNEITRIMQAWSRVMEKHIRQYPEQWVWLHERWKTQ